VNCNVINYVRTYEVKELTVPVTKMEELKKFYRVIAADETQHCGLESFSEVARIVPPRQDFEIQRIFRLKFLR